MNEVLTRFFQEMGLALGGLVVQLFTIVKTLRESGRTVIGKI